MPARGDRLADPAPPGLGSARTRRRRGQRAARLAPLVAASRGWGSAHVRHHRALRAPQAELRILYGYQPTVVFRCFYRLCKDLPAADFQILHMFSLYKPCKDFWNLYKPYLPAADFQILFLVPYKSYENLPVADSQTFHKGQ